jgi:hypothetical protein
MIQIRRSSAPGPSASNLSATNGTVIGSGVGTLKVSSAPESLKLYSSSILSRLSLIVEFQPWLSYTRLFIHNGKRQPPIKVLWDCFSLGAPLCTLLVLLGSPNPPHLKSYSGSGGGLSFFDIGEEERRAFVESWVERVRVMEMRDLLGYGEAVWAEDLFGGEVLGFAKVCFFGSTSDHHNHARHRF